MAVLRGKNYETEQIDKAGTQRGKLYLLYLFDPRARHRGGWNSHRYSQSLIDAIILTFLRSKIERATLSNVARLFILQPVLTTELHGLERRDIAIAIDANIRARFRSEADKFDRESFCCRGLMWPIRIEH